MGSSSAVRKIVYSIPVVMAALVGRNVAIECIGPPDGKDIQSSSYDLDPLRGQWVSETPSKISTQGCGPR